MNDTLGTIGISASFDGAPSTSGVVLDGAFERVRLEDVPAESLDDLAGTHPRRPVLVGPDLGPDELGRLSAWIDAWLRTFGQADAVVELDALPSTPSIWDVAFDPSAARDALRNAAERVRAAGSRVAWRLPVRSTSQAALQFLARSALVTDEDVLVLDVRDASPVGDRDALLQLRDVWPASPIWLLARAPERDRGALQAWRNAAALAVQGLLWHVTHDADVVAEHLVRFGAERMRRVLAHAPSGRGSGDRVLVTGGAGFIGTNVVERLVADQREVVILDNLRRPGVEQNLEWLLQRGRGRVRFVLGDVRCPETLDRVLDGVGDVLHLAGQVAVTTSLERPVEDFEINAEGTLNVLEAVRRRSRVPTVLFTSTNKVYGNLADLCFVDTGTRYAPEQPEIAERGIGEGRSLSLHSPYGCSKGSGDQYVIDYAHSYGIPAVVFRMSCIYGPRQFGTEDQGWVAHFVRCALEGRPVTIYGDGKQVRDILFVGDLVDAMMAAQANITALSGRAFNMGGGPDNTLSLLELIAYIERTQGLSLAVDFGAWRRGDQKYYVSDTRSFTRSTGWTPRISVQDGLDRLSAWLRSAFGERRSVRVQGAAVEGDPLCASS